MTQNQLDHYSKLGSLIGAMAGVLTLGFLIVFLVWFHGGDAPAAQPPKDAPKPAPTVPTPPPPKTARIDAKAALVKIQFGNAGCTGTIMATTLPDGRRSDGRSDILTANHCIEGQPSTGTMRLKDGREFTVRVVARNKNADCAWLVTDEKPTDLPYALLANSLPARGEKVWHMGYGVHIPGNLEEGTVTAPDNGDGQTQFRISVSSGDSGGGIALNANGEVVSCVCCTTAKGQVADVWGANVNEIRKLRGQVSDVWPEWKPIDVPLKSIPMQMEAP